MTSRCTDPPRGWCLHTHELSGPRAGSQVTEEGVSAPSQLSLVHWPAPPGQCRGPHVAFSLRVCFPVTVQKRSALHGACPLSVEGPRVPEGRTSGLLLEECPGGHSLGVDFPQCSRAWGLRPLPGRASRHWLAGTLGCGPCAYPSFPPSQNQVGDCGLCQPGIRSHSWRGTAGLCLAPTSGACILKG